MPYLFQVHFPSNPMQPGPIYFLTPRKCSVFSANCEAIPRQINFLADESGEMGRGANTVISYLHFYFDAHGLGEKKRLLASRQLYRTKQEQCCCRLSNVESSDRTSH